MNDSQYFLLLLLLQTGGLLISELLHESPVLEFGCRTADSVFNVSYNGSAEHHDELTILYADALISMDGFSLFQTLRACRSQLAVGKLCLYSDVELLNLSQTFLRIYSKVTFIFGCIAVVS